MWARRLLVALATVILGGISAAGASDPIGGTAAATPQATQTPEGGAARTLAVGDPIFLNDTLSTDAAGQALVLFADESSLTLGPNSEIFVDEFVYDGADSGLVFDLKNGLSRYIGGRISKNEDVTFNTPQGTVGIRGGIALIQVGEETWAAHQFGILTCQGGGEIEVLTKAGFACIVSPEGVEVIKVPPGSEDKFLAALTGTGLGEGGDITSLLDIFCDSTFGKNHKDCLAPDGGLAHTQPEDLGAPEEGGDEAEQTDEGQGTPLPDDTLTLCELNPESETCTSQPDYCVFFPNDPYICD